MLTLMPSLTFHLLPLAKSSIRLQRIIVGRVQDPEFDEGGITDIIDDVVVQKLVAMLPGLSQFGLRMKTQVTHRA